jgi:hypothetical protein
LNLRHLAPKASALPDCATPRRKKNTKFEFRNPKQRGTQNTQNAGQNQGVKKAKVLRIQKTVDRIQNRTLRPHPKGTEFKSDPPLLSCLRTLVFSWLICIRILLLSSVSCHLYSFFFCSLTLCAQVSIITFSAVAGARESHEGHTEPPRLQEHRYRPGRG